MTEELLQRLPDWLREIPWQWPVAVVVVVLAILLYRVMVHQIASQVADAEKRHLYRKRASYSIGTFVAVVLAIVLFEALRELGTVLGFLGAGLAIALREYVASFLAWFYLLGQRNVALGSRIEVAGVRGDVIDIGVLKLTLIEVRGEGSGEQSSGRLVSIPNFKLLTDPVYHFTAGSPFVWDEIEFAVTFESDWERAREILTEIGREVYEPHASEIESGFRRLESTYAFRYGITTPIVYTSVGGSGVTLRLRYLTHVRQRRDNRDRISREVLRRFREVPNVELAYPTSRVYRSEVDVERFGEKNPEEPRPEAEPLEGPIGRGLSER
ncbi:MAG TPA: mechanosensitive ion channel domain-containing protein [Gemmatimonadota bacterium]|nr:mechanosensitive ion channel domain-containing protein [Gemmatimonadota bacterium]